VGGCLSVVVLLLFVFVGCVLWLCSRTSLVVRVCYNVTLPMVSRRGGASHTKSLPVHLVEAPFSLVLAFLTLFVFLSPRCLSNQRMQRPRCLEVSSRNTTQLLFLVTKQERRHSQNTCCTLKKRQTSTASYPSLGLCLCCRCFWCGWWDLGLWLCFSRLWLCFRRLRRRYNLWSRFRLWGGWLYHFRLWGRWLNHFRNHGGGWRGENGRWCWSGDPQGRLWLWWSRIAGPRGTTAAATSTN
jgi:hypothetical protein